MHTCFIGRCVSSYYPHFISMLVVGSEYKTNHRFSLTFCIYCRDSEAKSLAPLKHKVGKEYLRRNTKLITSEMYVFWGTCYDMPGTCCYLHQLSAACPLHYF